jgi:hypothetical protein
VLREDMAKLKASVSQIRNQCATDIRRRDGEIKRLKKHLDGRRGREGNGGQVGVVILTPGLAKGYAAGSNTAQGMEESDGPPYSLKEDTNEFLTQLSRDLTEQNDALTALAQNTLATLRALQGLPESIYDTENPNGYVHDPNVTLLTPPSFSKLETETASVLSHLRSLLTNPSFVPLEEVEVRDHEIVALRQGWERMESRWREAVAMMNGWRKKIVEEGDTINLEDVRKGLMLTEEIVKNSPYKPSTEAMDNPSTQDEGESSLVSASNQSIITEGEEPASLPSPSPRSKYPARRLVHNEKPLFPAPHILQPFSSNVQRSFAPLESSPRPAPSPSSSIDPLQDSSPADSTPSKRKPILQFNNERAKQVNTS